jgi:hypothetical protein
LVHLSAATHQLDEASERRSDFAIGKLRIRSGTSGHTGKRIAGRRPRQGSPNKTVARRARLSGAVGGGRPCLARSARRSATAPTSGCPSSTSAWARFCRCSAQLICTEPHDRESPCTTVPSGTLLTRANAAQANPSGRTRTSRTRLKTARSAVRPCGRCVERHAHGRRLPRVATPPRASRLPAGRYPKTDAGHEDPARLWRDPRRDDRHPPTIGGCGRVAGPDQQAAPDGRRWLE